MVFVRCVLGCGCGEARDWGGGGGWGGFLCDPVFRCMWCRGFGCVCLFFGDVWVVYCVFLAVLVVLLLC